MNNNIVFKYFELTKVKMDKISCLKDIYSFWNSRVNLISRKDFVHFYQRHVLHSLSICKVFDFNVNQKIMDLGTGGGFPGIPLAIMYPDVSFFLVDSINKKTKVVKEIARELKLDNVTVYNQRVEDVDGVFDFIVSRAVAKVDKINLWTHNKISKKSHSNFKNGLIFLKGGDISNELKELKKKNSIYAISDFFEEDFFKEKKIIHIHN